jgi:hypothetical protein
MFLTEVVDKLCRLIFAQKKKLSQTQLEIAMGIFQNAIDTPTKILEAFKHSNVRLTLLMCFSCMLCLYNTHLPYKKSVLFNWIRHVTHSHLDLITFVVDEAPSEGKIDPYEKVKKFMLRHSLHVKR